MYICICICIHGEREGRGRVEGAPGELFGAESCEGRVVGSGRGHREECQAHCLVQVRRPVIHLVPRGARIQGSQTCVSLNSRLEGDKEEVIKQKNHRAAVKGSNFTA